MPSRREFLTRTGAALAAFHLPVLAGPAHGQSQTVWEKKVHLRQLLLRSRHIPEQETYYREVLRVPVERNPKDHLVVTLGSSTLEFMPHTGPDDPFYHVAFTIPENQLDAARQWLEPRCPILPINSRGDEIMHFRNWNAHSIFFHDPAGNILEFIAHHDLANAVDGAFDESRIQYISEIGVVVPDVAAFEQEMNGRFGLTPYRGHSPAFSPLGDIGGLLITVQEGRIWLPKATKQAATVYPTDISLAGLGRSARYEAGSLPYTIAHL